jgi:hypothetical protein
MERGFSQNIIHQWRAMIVHRLMTPAVARKKTDSRMMRQRIILHICFKKATPQNAVLLFDKELKTMCRMRMS